MAGIYSTSEVSIHAFGLVPGTKYCASFAFSGDDGTDFNEGMSQQAVSSTGTISFSNEWTDVNPQLKPGTLLAWIRVGAANGGRFNDPPVVVDGVELKQEIHYP